MNAPIKITSQKFYKELSATSVNFALGNVGDKIRIETEFTVQNFAIASSKNPFIINCTDGYVGTGWIKSPLLSFKNFKVGDTLVLFNSTSGFFAGSPYTIIDKLSDSEIQLQHDIGTLSGIPDNTRDGTMVISLASPITSIKYHYNFIENSAAPVFTSSIDGSEQLYKIQSKLADDTTVSNLIGDGSPNWQDGSATIEGVSIDPGTTDGVYRSKYKIIHYTKISPFILHEQLSNQVGTPPADFLYTKCWKFVTLIEAAEAYTNPNFLVSEVFDTVLGNTGWYNENYNTGKTKYSVSDVAYDNGGTIASIRLDATETTITFNVNNTSETPFTINQQFVLHFFKVPADSGEYTGNSKTPNQNFLYDRALQTVGSAAVNGDNYGGTYQVLKQVSASLTSSGHIAVTCKIHMSSAVIDSFKASSNPMYFLAISTQKYGVATDSGVNDLVTLQIDMNNFTVITTDSGMIVMNNVFIRHPEVNPATEGVTPGTAPGNDPTPLNYTVVGSPGTVAIDNGVNCLGVADFDTDLNTTMILLVDSVNNDISHGTNFTIYPFGNPDGYTASYNSGTGTFTLSAPAGSGAEKNGTPASITNHDGGDWEVFPLFTQDFSGGIDPVVTTFDVYPQDEIVACTNFYIESSGRRFDQIKLTSIKAQIIAKNGSSSFVLDQFIMQLSSYPRIGYTQQFDAQVARGFHVPAGTIRKYIEVKRRKDLDSGTRYYFSCNYPFLFRWETWTTLLGVNAAFFDPTKPNDGFNEWWYQYAQVAGWGIYLNVTVNATKVGFVDGVTSNQVYNLQQLITPHDYASNSEFTTKDVLPFDPSSLASLLSGAGGATQLVTGGTTYVTINGQRYYKNGQDYVFTYQKTLIAAVFTKTSLPANVCVELDVEIWQQGGIYGKRRYSSAWVADNDTWFSSIDGSGKIVLHAYGNNIVALCYLDPSTLNFPASVQSWSFSPRIYEIGGVLETDDGVPITNDDGVQIEVD